MSVEKFVIPTRYVTAEVWAEEQAQAAFEASVQPIDPHGFEYIIDGRDVPSVEDLIVQQDMAERVHELVSTAGPIRFSEDEVTILANHLLSNKPLNPPEIGRLLGLTTYRVTETLRTTQNKIRAYDRNTHEFSDYIIEPS
ncbi:MAG: hypothetical protein ABIQ89_03785 [Candidatus Saccharimonadales bacterium]